MEKKKKQDISHWVIPGVFCGAVEAQDAVQRISDADLPATGGSTVTRQHAMDEQFRAELAVSLNQLRTELLACQQQLKRMQDEQKRDRDHLYQMVLLLKQEWERARNEPHR